MKYFRLLLLGCLGWSSIMSGVFASDSTPQEDSTYDLNKRTVSGSDSSLRRSVASVTWRSEETAVIVCDVWDYHHCRNAVNRLDEMTPRMDALLKEARRRGSIIIHSPSDCMPAYEGHAARARAQNVAKADLPQEIASWCGKIDAERDAIYPLDQSDGGEDDDPAEHAAWSAKLKQLGRNPSMPWKAQSPALTIDPQRDYISDRGDEVWAILKDRGIKHVILIGVHANMCVIGRPFGLRQMVRNGMDVALVRDLTDCMYNPKSWPYVDHFTGNDLLISYVERHVCPTMTSDQILGGEPVQFKQDQRAKRDLLPSEIPGWRSAKPVWPLVQWSDQAVGATNKGGPASSSGAKTWLRCALRFASESLDAPLILETSADISSAWINGAPVQLKEKTATHSTFEIRKDQTFGNDDANILVIQCDGGRDQIAKLAPPKVITKKGSSTLVGKWQVFAGEGNAPTNIPLPAKFGLPPQILYTAP